MRKWNRTRRDAKLSDVVSQTLVLKKALNHIKGVISLIPRTGLEVKTVFKTPGSTLTATL